MIAEIICVGTEILLGDIVNTNAQFLAKELARLGIGVHYQTVVGDNPARLKAALKIAFSRADMVVMTGGLGPTKDDLTKEMIAEFFEKELVFDEEAYDRLVKRLEQYGVAEISASNRKQALVPEGCIVLYNDNGTAPGYIVENNGKTAILFPGPPHEMKPMFQAARTLYLSKISDKTIVSVNIKIKSRLEEPVANVGESAVADQLSELLDLENPTVAPYAKEDGVLIRVTAMADSRADARLLISPVTEKICGILGTIVASVNEAE